MRNLEKYKGVIPAFYACYDEEGNVSPEGVRALTKYFVEKGVKGVYVNGSSGECIYQSVEDRKIILENVMKAAPCEIGLSYLFGFASINSVACAICAASFISCPPPSGFPNIIFDAISPENNSPF